MSNPELFEMRRIEMLSNTVFGVAMTLLAYDLPKTGAFASLPDWTDLYRLYAGKLASLVLSFVIAGLFWISHHRRLAQQPEAGRGIVILNLLFLLSIILLPVTNGLYGNYRLSSAVAVLYGIHLTVIGSLNALLWWLARKQDLHDVAGAIFPVLVFVPGTVVAAFVPQYVQYFWCLAFGALLVRRFTASKPEARASQGP
ncbi:MAG: TMEM175 family protein [Bradyrhizobium sp.]|uniref:TMEM175 family protein n=1 Tax=Bradyrhizobium sp. TaxID=376 RepID=UPI003D0EE93F